MKGGGSAEDEVVIVERRGDVQGEFK